MALCKSCGNEVEESASFCTTCGQRMPAGVERSAAVTVTRPVCSGCGAQCDADSIFCTECGHRLAAQPADDLVPAVVPAEVAGKMAPQPVVATPLAVVTAAGSAQPPVEPIPPVPAPPYAAPNDDEPARPRTGAFHAIVLTLLLLIVFGGFGGWYFMGVETVIVCSPPDVAVFLDGKELAPTSYGRYLIPHLSRQPHFLKVQRAGFADTIEKLDFPLTASRVWVNIRLVPSRQAR